MYVRGVCVSIFDVWVNVLVILVIAFWHFRVEAILRVCK